MKYQQISEDLFKIAEETFKRMLSRTVRSALHNLDPVRKVFYKDKPASNSAY